MMVLVSMAAALALTLPADQGPPQPTADEVAQARARGDALIQAANAADLFENISGGDAVIQIKHLASGMVCTFSGAPSERVLVFDAPGGLPRGDDVGCDTSHPDLGLSLTLYATRYQPMPSQQAVAADAERAIRARFPDAQPYDGQLTSVSLEGIPDPSSVAYRIDVNGVDSLTMALVSHRGAWGFKARSTGAHEDVMMVSMVTSLFFQNAIMER